MKIYNIFQLFLMERCSYCSGKTIQYYQENIKKFLFYLSKVVSPGTAPEELTFEVVTRQVVFEYITWLREKGLKNTSINTYFRAVKAFLNYCIEENYVSPDVLRRVKMLRSDEEPVIPLYNYEMEMIDRVFNLKTELGLRNYCIVHLMVDAGFRCSDVINLRVCDVFFDKNCLQVRGKGNKFRSVVLCPTLKKNLYKYLITYRSFVFDAGGDYLNQPVFVQVASAEFINSNTIKQMFQRLKVRSGVERVHPHLLRHTFATSYILGGGNMEFLRLMMGHTDYNVTRNYLHLANQSKMLGSDVYKLDPIFFKTAY